MKYLFFLDESGDMGINGSNFFIITIFSINFFDIKKLDYINKRARRNRFKKELSGKKEIKGYYSSNEIISFLFDSLIDIDFVSYSIVMDKKSFKNMNLLKNCNNHMIYLDMVKQLLNTIDIGYDVDLRVDRFVPKNFIKIFNEKIIKIFNNHENRTNMSKNRFNINIHHSQSENWLGIQIADVIGWCCFQKFEKNNPKLIEKLNKNHFIIKYSKK